MRRKRVLIIVQNLSVPFDRRVWLEACSLRDAGFQVSVVCPMGAEDEAYEVLDGIRIRRYPPPPDTHGFTTYVYEFAYCWLRTARREDPRQVPGLVGQYARTGPVTMARAMDAARKDRLEQTLERLACPVLVVRGRHDAICDESWARAVERAASNGSRAVSLPAGAHMVPSTHGSLVAAEIAAFLSEVG